MLTDEIDDEECYCTCEGLPLLNSEDCDHTNLMYCKCCGRVYCLDCSLKWGEGDCCFEETQDDTGDSLFAE